MATKKKMLQAAAGSAAGGGGLDIDDVFSTYLYEGNGSTQTITNGIDLDGEGGLVWIKRRTTVGDNELYDTERGATYSLSSNATYASLLRSTGLTSFSSDGFTVGSRTNVNASGTDYASWTFRKAPKFFDVVTYTGDGTLARAIPHNLGTDVGSIFVKRTDSSSSWHVYHRSLPLYAANHPYVLFLNTTGSITAFSTFKGGIPDSSNFYVDGVAGAMNQSGETYVAYLFAHNDGDGDFGPDGDQDIIKCGSFTTNGSFDASIDLGFEPQWVMIKKVDASGSWFIIDSMRGITTGGNDQWLIANGTNSEGSTEFGHLTATGFEITDNFGTNSEHIYMAIRRGPLAVPEDATEVFAVDKPVSPGAETFPYFTSGFPVDMFLNRTNIGSLGSSFLLSRLTGDNVALKTNTTDAEISFYTNDRKFDSNTGVWEINLSASDDISWMWKRAPGYFDAVAYTGNGTAGHTVSHNLGVAPEMMWVKVRAATYAWTVYHKDIGATDYLQLNNTNASATRVFNWNDTEPTTADFTVGAGFEVNRSGFAYIAYLFASAPGVSKVGSYTGNGSSSGQNIDCGFTSGARFILIKRTDSTSNWLVFDTERGITVGNDPYLKLDVTDAETTNPIVDPYSSGFKLQGTIWNGSGENYIFYAIA